MSSFSLILTISLFFIGLVVSIFAIVYPIRVSNRDYNEIKNTQLAITELVAGINVRTKATQDDLREIIKNLLDKAIDKTSINERDKIEVKKSVDDVLLKINEINLMIEDKIQKLKYNQLNEIQRNEIKKEVYDLNKERNIYLHGRV
jgi:hypothetical protein